MGRKGSVRCGSRGRDSKIKSRRASRFVRLTLSYKVTNVQNTFQEQPDTYFGTK